MPEIADKREFHANEKSSFYRFLGSPRHLVALAVSLVVIGVFGSVSTVNPPGFFRDEASVALNASTIAASGRDEYGARFPLFFESLGDFRSPAFVYALAGVFVVTGPSTTVARSASAFLGLAAVVVVGLIGWRLTRRRAVGLLAGVIAGLTPWLFEVTRVAFEWSATPVAFALVLLCALEGSRQAQWGWRLPVATGLALAFLTYSYQTGRIYGPALAAGLALLVTRDRLPGLLLTWAMFVATVVVPVAVFNLRHPGALTARYDTTTFIQDDMSRFEIARTFVTNYAWKLNLFHWTFSGDPNVRHHVQGAGTLLLGLVFLAIAGAWIVIARHRRDRFWWFFLSAFLIAPAPASLTIERYHAPRLEVLPICLCVLAVPAVDLLVGHLASGPSSSARMWSRGAIVVLALVVAGQATWFQTNYWRHGGSRQEAFEAGADDVMRAAFQSSPDGRVFVSSADKRGKTQLEWWSIVFGRNDGVVVLADGQAPPPGATIVARGDPCVGCTTLLQRDAYVAYRQTG